MVLDILKQLITKFKEWVDIFIDKTPNIILSLIVFFVGLNLSRFIRDFVVKILEKRNVKRSARNMIGNITSVTIVFCCIVVALNILNLDYMFKTMLASAGVAGLAIGLALQGTLSNTFSGVALSFFKDLKIGDQIETNGFIGDIEDINLRVVKLRTTDFNMVSIPNKLIIENPLKNFSESKEARIMITCGVAYNSDLEKVKIIAMDAVNARIPQIHPNTTVLFYKEFADSSINFELRFVADAKNVMEINMLRSEAILAIKSAFDKNGVNIPFPIRTVMMNNDK